MKKIIILTTNTLHHNYFINELSKKFNLIIIYENIIKKSQNSKFEIATNSFENKKIGIHKKLKNKKKIKIYKKNCINSVGVKSLIKKYKNKIILSFGVKKISKDILDVCGKNIYNFHGGNVKKYRGLDSNYWAIYNNDFNSIHVTLHKVNTKLDTGRIVSLKKIKLNKKSNLFNLRIETTRVCLILAENILSRFLENKKILLKDKHRIGKYYSKMPSFLHNQVYINFKKKISSL